MAESNRIFNLITPFINQVQLIENMLDDVRKKRLLTSATNNQLDSIGDIIGLTRAGLSDDNYRIALYRQILLNMSSGQPENIIEYIDSIASSPFRLCEPYMASILVYMHEIISPWSLLFNGVNNLRPIGVNFEVIHVEDESLTFNFGDEDGHVTDGYGFLENGYDEITGDYTAGILTEKITNY
jgi:hypothetical protein